jgi:hypothetical protein
MPKAKNQGPAHNTPNYEALLSVEEIDEEIEKRKNILVGKDRTEYQIKENKREYVAAMNEQLRDLKEEREHEINVLSALDQRKTQLLNGAGITPLRGA